MKILISGASIAGPVLAYWLSRHGFDVTVVERSPALRKTGGHAVDLFRPAMEISERMGVLPDIEAHATGTTRMFIHRPGSSRPARLDYVKLIGAMSDRHVEIMRDDLSEIYYRAGRDDVEYLFGDTITSISADGDVTFEHSPPRRFDVVVGADGLHSGVRRLTFGDNVAESFLGGYLSVVSVPKDLARDGEMTGYLKPGHMAGIYTADHLDDARAVFIFRPTQPLDYDYRDVDRQKTQLHAAFEHTSPEVDRWLEEIPRTPTFYFDAITQLQMRTWSRGRVTLVGDAGYCPGPAVGGSTSLAVYGAYVLAAEMVRAGDDHAAAFAAYERTLLPRVEGSRKLAAVNAKTVVPMSGWGIRALVGAGQLISLLPLSVTQALARLNTKGVRLYDTMPLPTWPAPLS
ncbi:FAD-dependent monooxygenase [Mycolicibacterium fortuitum]|uniref:Oxidoreductase n=1 Tax=Mycolicibacterium fortuitum subsp. fortuitum DSM 46621 = ATCC 6841 = JCM 6387 TaxID=1214102 RepID=K0V2I8_MYCFO|nr:FAD-dependent monooxygenase [Mycolicibacterium fortuitum]AIY45149.1 Oxidoreductase [Mycobacterium sp. VKM Ac-1817D]CRL80349.1 oxidoreductase [Mycolicibacter nonchromogenicus]EJZ13537.1 oxidoreductase [Mycolicibacterium fortuitum subsp. fortuitum DSM 46621 = ATCC 6841 = JCM 6387]WEV33918.1 FAD-dependent monooxygenase [Mycolicibacterium fortuitum]CRL55111.1 oxidoreductase [Mycolicibacterium fortuitum subsp. fortuitum DSM 46621 = ATCC 6841 = JCM 6387]